MRVLLITRVSSFDTLLLAVSFLVRDCMGVICGVMCMCVRVCVFCQCIWKTYGGKE